MLPIPVFCIRARSHAFPDQSFDTVSPSSAEQEQDIFLIRIQLKIELDNGCKAFHAASQICVTGSKIDPAEPRSIIQHERDLRSVTGVLLRLNWISLQKKLPFRITISGWNPFLTDSCFIGRLISTNEIFCSRVSSAGLVITRSSFEVEATKASFLRILCQ